MHKLQVFHNAHTFCSITCSASPHIGSQHSFSSRSFASTYYTNHFYTFQTRVQPVHISVVSTHSPLEVLLVHIIQIIFIHFETRYIDTRNSFETMNITRPPLRLHVLLAFLLNTLHTVTTSSTATLRTSNITLELPDEQRLLMKLLKNYDSNVRPAMNSSVSVEVTFGFSLIQIMDMDEKNQVLTINAWLESYWTDPRIHWHPEQFNNLQVFRVPSKYIWLPDIVLYNNADDYTNGFMPCNLMLHADGTVFWPPPAKLRSSCQVDIAYFPFDWQTCKLKFGSWSYDKAQVDLLNKTSVVDVTNYVTNGEWTLHEYNIIRNEVVYPLSDAVYVDVTIVLVIQRRILYYVLNILFPCFWLNILSVLTFCLPVDAGEKMTLSITVLLSYSVFMLLVADTMPPTSETVPLIVIYLTMSMSMSSLSIVITVLVEKLHFCSPHQKPLPVWAKTLILGFFARIVGCTFVPSLKSKCRLRSTVSYPHLPEILVTPSPTTNTNTHHELSDQSVKLLHDEKTMQPDNLTGISTHSNTVYDSTSRHSLSVLNDDNLSLDVRSSNRKSSSSLGDWTRPSNDFRLTSVSPQRLSVGSEGVRVSLYESASSGMDELLKYLRTAVDRAEKQEESTAITEEWKQAAIVLDRLMFWSFLFITVFSALVILVFVPASRFREETHGI